MKPEIVDIVRKLSERIGRLPCLPVSYRDNERTGNRIELSVPLIAMTLKGCGGNGGTLSPEPPTPPQRQTEGLVVLTPEDPNFNLGTGATNSLTIIGTAGANSIFTGNFDDNINAGTGDDIISTGNGADVIRAGGGNDTVNAGAGDDIIILIGTNGPGNVGPDGVLTDYPEDPDILFDVIQQKLAATGIASSEAVVLSERILNLLPRSEGGRLLLNHVIDDEGLSIRRLDGGNGSDTLLIFGNVDLSGLTASHLLNIEGALVNSLLQLTGSQLQGLGTAAADIDRQLVITGDGPNESTLHLTSSVPIVIDASPLKLTGLRLLLDENVTLRLSPDSREALDDVVLTGFGTVEIMVAAGASESSLLLSEAMRANVIIDGLILCSAPGTTLIIDLQGASQLQAIRSLKGDIQPEGPDIVIQVAQIPDETTNVSVAEPESPRIEPVEIVLGEDDTATTTEGTLKATSRNVSEWAIQGSSPDGDATELSAQGIYGILTLDPLTGAYRYRLNENAPALQALDLGDEGLDAFTVSATAELSGARSSAPFRVLVTGANDTPVIEGDAAFMVDRGESHVLTTEDFSATDPDADDGAEELVWNLIRAPQHGLLASTSNMRIQVNSFTQSQLANGEIIYVHDGSNFAEDRLTLGVTDGQTSPGATSTVLNVTIREVNLLPEAITLTSVVTSLTEGVSTGMVVAHIDVTDPDGGRVDFTLAGEDAGLFMLNPAQTQILLRPGQIIMHTGDAGLAIRVQLTDDAAIGDDLVIPINNINDPPVFTSSALAVAEGSTIVFSDLDLGASDPDVADTPARLEYSLLNLPGFGELERLTASTWDPLGPTDRFTQQEINDGRIRYVHGGSESTSDRFTVEVADPAGESDTTEVVIIVTPVDDLPASLSLVAFKRQITEGLTARSELARISVTDIDGGLPFLELTGANDEFFEFDDDANPSKLFLKAGQDIDADTYSSIGVRVQVRGTNGVIGDDLTLAVTNSNSAPQIVNRNFTVAEGETRVLETADLQARDSDVSDNAAQLSLTLVSLPRHGKLQMNLTPAGEARWSDLSVSSSFSQEDIDDGRIRYVHNGTDPTTDIPSDSFRIRVADDNQPIPALSANTFVRITVTAVDDPVTALFLRGGNSQVTPGVTVRTKLADIVIIDQDGGLPNLELTGDDAAFFEFDNDINPTALYLKGGETLSASTNPFLDVRVAVRDSAVPVGTDFRLRVTTDNGTPVLDRKSFTVLENDVRTLTTEDISAIDPDLSDGPGQLTFTLLTDPENGNLERRNQASSTSWTTLRDGDTFTQEDINTGLVRYRHVTTGQQDFQDLFTISLADDEQPVPATISATVQVYVEPSDRPPTAVRLDVLRQEVPEGTTMRLKIANIVVTDADGGAPRLQLVGMDRDFFEFDNALDPNALFLKANLLLEESTNPFLDVRVQVTDSSPSIGADLGVAVVENNRVPTIGNASFLILPGDSKILTPTDILATDPDPADGPVQLTFTLSSTPIHGRLEFRPDTTGTEADWAELAPGRIFTQQDINAGKLRYVHDGSETSSDGFRVTVMDDEQPIAGISPETRIAITITGSISPDTTMVPDPIIDTPIVEETPPMMPEEEQITSPPGNQQEEDVAVDPEDIDDSGQQPPAPLAPPQSGMSDDDTLTGTSNPDVLNGLDGSDLLLGLGDNDTLNGGQDADTLDGGDGTDLAIFRESIDGVTVDLSEADISASGFATASGGDAKNDLLKSIENIVGSNAGDDFLTGNDDPNWLLGLGGNDTLLGKGDNDTLTGGPGSDSLDGGDGSDLVIYTDSTEGITIDLSVMETTGTGGQAQGDRLRNIENIHGTQHPDFLTGNDEANDLRGFSGADTMIGHGGPDVFRGGEGGDTLEGGDGYDQVIYTQSRRSVTVDLSQDPDINGYISASGGDAEGDRLSGIEGLTGSASANDTLTGDDNGNLLYGFGGNDVLTGNDGNDRLSGGSGTDTLDGGPGSDSIIYANSPAGITIDLATIPNENNYILGIGGNAEDDRIRDVENVVGSNHNDRLNGTELTNDLRGLDGNDSLTGGPGDDFLSPGDGNDTVDGGDGTDRVSYTDAPLGVTINLALTPDSQGYITASGSHAQGDRLRNIENLSGSNRGDDHLTGNVDSNILFGLGGDDSLFGSGGNDILVGGDGADLLEGNIGFDQILYSSSTQGVTINLEGVPDSQGYITASGGDAAGDRIRNVESITGSSHKDWIVGDNANNQLIGGAGDDRLDGAKGQDILFGGDGKDTLLGSEGNDNLFPGAAIDILDGGDGSDTATYSDSPEALNVDLSVTPDESGYIIAAGGYATGDRLRNVENITGSAASDILTGNANNNQLSGLGGNDQIRGNDGQDVLLGGEENDILDGGNGNDYLYPGSGNDTLDGGDGFDIIVYSASVNGVTVNLSAFAGLDGFIPIPAGNSDASNDRLKGIEGIIGSATGNNVLTGSNFANQLHGGGGMDTLSGGGGNDVLNGGAGQDILDGGPGTDRIAYTNSPSAVTIDLSAPADASGYITGIGGEADGDLLRGVEGVFGSAKDDLLTGNNDNNELHGQAGNDTLVGGEGNDLLFPGTGANNTLRGGGGADSAIYQNVSEEVLIDLEATPDADGFIFARIGGIDQDRLSSIESLTGSGAADDILSGDSNNNQLSGLGGNDQLAGRDGQDTLIGGAGEDTLDGGPGFDTASYAASPQGVTVNLTDTPDAEGYIDTFGGEAQGDRIKDIEALIGSGSGDDKLTGNVGNNVFFGQGGDDTISAGQDNDFLYGDAGDDSLDGGSGNDNLRPGAGSDIVDGGEDMDTVDYRFSMGGVTIDLSSPDANGNIVGVLGDAEGDLLRNVEGLIGSDQGDDLLTGDHLNNNLEGRQGDDTLIGNEGIDNLRGGIGADALDGGPGSDWALYSDSQEGVTIDLTSAMDAQGYIVTSGGDAMDDRIRNIENLYGSRHDDTLTGNASNNNLRGGAGDDTLNSGDGRDILYGDDGTDTLIGGNDNDNLFPGADTVADVVDGGSGFDQVSYSDFTTGVTINLGSTMDAEGFIRVVSGIATGDRLKDIENLAGSNIGSDLLIGDNSDNALSGLSGNDTLRGMGGNDILRSGTGNDTLDGGTGSDTVAYENAATAITINLGNMPNELGFITGSGGAADDRIKDIESIIGSGFDDVLTGNDSNNILNGMGGADTLTGMDGTDTLNGGSGMDILDGAMGSDYLSYATSPEGVSIDLTGFEDAEGYFTGVGGDAEGDRIRNVENILGSAKNDFLIGNDESNLLQGLGGNDSLSGSDGNDILIGGDSGDTMDGGEGFDQLNYSQSPMPVTINLALPGDASGFISAGEGGHATGDRIRNIEGVSGTAHDDSLFGDAVSNNLVGQGGNDTLRGNDGNDALNGGRGADLLDGGIGVDRITYQGQSSTVGITIDLASTQDADGFITAFGGDAEGDRIKDIETIIGSGFDDFLGGNDEGNQLSGLDGDDTLNGGGDNDLLFGGRGFNTMDGGEGSDFTEFPDLDEGITVDLSDSTDAQGYFPVSGSDGTVLSLIKNIENISATPFNDLLIGDGAPNLLQGAAGNDILEGGRGRDNLVGEAGDDTLTGGPGTDTLDGGTGADTIIFLELDSDNRDVIKGFELGLDRIDLSALDADSGLAGNQEFLFIGTASFTADAAGQLRYTLLGNTLILEASIDEDADVEFSLIIEGISAISVAELIL